MNEERGYGRKYAGLEIGKVTVPSPDSMTESRATRATRGQIKFDPTKPGIGQEKGWKAFLRAQFGNR